MFRKFEKLLNPFPPEEPVEPPPTATVLSLDKFRKKYAQGATAAR